MDIWLKNSISEDIKACKPPYKMHSHSQKIV